MSLKVLLPVEVNEEWEYIVDKWVFDGGIAYGRGWLASYTREMWLGLLTPR